MSLTRNDSFSFISRDFQTIFGNDGTESTYPFLNHWHTSLNPRFSLEIAIGTDLKKVSSREEAAKRINERSIASMGVGLLWIYMQSNTYLDGLGEHFIYDVTPSRFKGVTNMRKYAETLTPLLTLGATAANHCDLTNLRTINAKTTKELVYSCNKSYIPVEKMLLELQ